MTATADAAPPEAGVYRRRSAWVAAWPLFPLLIYLGILFLYPVGQLLWLSILDDGGALSGEHYTKLFARTTYVKVLGITFRIAAWTTLYALLAGYPVAYLLATINERMWLGHFDVDSDEHTPMFRHTTLLRGAQGASVEQLEDLVDIALTECERFYPAFQFVIWGGKSAPDAVSAAILDTVAEA